MKHVLRIAVGTLLALYAGCAITNYELITDNDQYKKGDTIVNTNGKALIHYSFQVATIWPDGSDNLFSMVDQKANGDRTLTTYNWYATGDTPRYMDWLYCNPDWVGCSILTSPDPEVGDDDIFDGTWNWNCSGSRTIDILLSTTRYYGECGRVLRNLTPAQKAMALQMLKATDHGFFGTFDASSTSIFLTGTDGIRHALPVFAGTFDIDWRTRSVRLDLTNPNVATMLRYADDLVRQSPDNVFEATIRWNGLEISRDIKILEGRLGETAVEKY